jgi:FkbM family methyltransferase
MRKEIIKLLKNLGLLGVAKQLRGLSIAARSELFGRIYPNGKYVNCNGGEVFVDFHDANHLWYFGKNEFLLQEHAAFVELLNKKTPNVVLDIGAHWGVFPAQLAADKAALGVRRVVCIEPDPRNIPILQKTVQPIDAFEVNVVQVAISDKPGSIGIYAGGGTCAQTYSTDTSRKIGEVRAAPLEDVLRDLKIAGNDVTHIKLDIDGYEPAFFNGARSFLLENKPLLLIEFWAKGIKAAGFNLTEYWQMIHSMYDVSEIVYPDNYHLRLTLAHLDYLEEKTENAVVNLILIPRA